MNYIANENLVIAYLCQRGGGTQAIFIYYWMNSEIVCIINYLYNGLTFRQYSHTFTQVFVCYLNFEYTKAVTRDEGKSRRQFRPRSCNRGDPSWVKSTSSFFSSVVFGRQNERAGKMREQVK